MSSSIPTRIVFVRHGEVEQRYHRIFGGRVDMDLSPLGRQQAIKTASYLKRHDFEAVFCSPMKRARQTLEPLMNNRSNEVTFLDELREVDFGAWTGLGWQEVFEKFQISAFDWLTALNEGRIVGAEPEPQFRSRIQKALTHILALPAGSRIAVVCHGGVIRMFLSILLNIPLPRTAGFEIDYASITIVDYRPNKTETTLLNFTPWRDLH